MIRANELCPGDKAIKEAFVIYKDRKANYHKKSREIGQKVFNLEESENALKERKWVFEEIENEAEKEKEDIPGFMN